jgi:hypothetical protein
MAKVGFEPMTTVVERSRPRGQCDPRLRPGKTLKYYTHRVCSTCHCQILTSKMEAYYVYWLLFSRMIFFLNKIIFSDEAKLHASGKCLDIRTALRYGPRDLKPRPIDVFCDARMYSLMAIM